MNHIGSIAITLLDHYGGHIIESDNVSPFLSRLTLTEDEKKDVISFLKALTDIDFINNKKFSDPDL
jgi:hypothetical protein